MASNTPSVAALHRAIKISEQIEKLQAELASILGTSSGSAPTGKRKYTKKAPVTGKRTYTKRAAAVGSEGDDDANAVITSLLGKKRKKAKMSEEGRAAIVAAQKARWAKVKKAKKAKAKKAKAKEEAQAAE